jgi:hypothetical protein
MKTIGSCMAGLGAFYIQKEKESTEKAFLLLGYAMYVSIPLQ